MNQKGEQVKTERGEKEEREREIKKSEGREG